MSPSPPRPIIATSDKLIVHCLRKSYAQNLADVGTPAPTLKKLMGHASIATTDEFYLKSSDANEQRACPALDTMMKANPADVFLTFSTDSDKRGSKGIIATLLIQVT